MRSLSFYNYSTPHDHLHPSEARARALRSATSTSGTFLPLEEKRRVSLWSILPGIATFIASAGTATVLLVWLWTRRITDHPVSEEHFFRNAIVALEQPGVGKNTGESFLYGLAIASVASTIVPICVPLLMGMVAYRIAAVWIKESYEPDSRPQIPSSPTPQQYSLLLKVCGSSNLYAAYETGRYLIRSKRYPKVASTLRRAFSLLVVILLLSHGVGIADFWLHTTASSFVHASFTPMLPAEDADPFGASMPSMGSIINETACPGPSPSFRGSSDYWTNCQSFYYGSPNNSSWGTSEMFNEAAVAGSNQSAISGIHFVASSSGQDIAVIVPTNMPDPSDMTNITFPTFGISSQCQPITDCAIDPPDLLCRRTGVSPAFNITGETIRTFNEDVLPFDAATNEVSLDGYLVNSTINPFNAVFILNYDNANDIQKYNMTPGWHSVVDTSTNVYFIGSCQMSMYELNVTETERRYSLSGNPRLTDFNTTSALLAAYQTTLTSNMVMVLQSQMETSIGLPSEDFVKLLARNISAASIGYASPLMQRTRPYSAGKLQTVSRYPLPALIMLVGCLYLYGLLALAFSVWAGISRSSESSTGLTQLEVAQRYLTDSAAIVARHFSDDGKGGSATDLFNEEEGAERLDAGSLGRGGIGLRRSPYQSEDVVTSSLLSLQPLP